MRLAEFCEREGQIVFKRGRAVDVEVVDGGLAAGLANDEAQHELVARTHRHAADTVGAGFPLGFGIEGGGVQGVGQAPVRPAGEGCDPLAGTMSVGADAGWNAWLVFAPVEVDGGARRERAGRIDGGAVERVLALAGEIGGEIGFGDDGHQGEAGEYGE